MEYVLKHPVLFGEKIVDRLDFPDRLKAKHMRGVTIGSGGGLAVNDMIILVSNATNQPPSLIGELDAADFVAVAGVLAGFLGPGQETGGK